MQPNVPVATDSLHKFLALFGLVLIVSSIIGIVLMGWSSNEQIFAAAREFAHTDPSHSEAMKTYADAMVKKAEITASDRKLLIYALSGVIAFGTFIAGIGFIQWSRIQPLQDELLELQVAKARVEVHGVNEYRELPARPAPKKESEDA